MSLTIPVTYVDGQKLAAQQLNSCNQAIATQVNTNETNIATNTSDITTANTNIAKYGKNAFFAQSSGNTTVLNGATTTIAIATEVTDNDGIYNNSTYTATPNQAGTYMFTVSCQATSVGAGNATLYICKNSTPYTVGVINTAANGGSMGGTVIVSANGTSDAFLVKVNASADDITIGSVSFSGFCVKPS